MEELKQWNSKQKQLREWIGHEETFTQAKELFIEMHRLCHFKNSSQEPNTLMDDLWEGLKPEDFAMMPTVKDCTIAWNIWHLTRIEDLTANLLMNQADQIYNPNWAVRLNTSVTDTGNAMSDEEICSLSHELDMKALKEYRIAVGQQTQKILRLLSWQDLKRTFSEKQKNRIITEKGVLSHPDSIWLADFWGKKNVAGIILMPLTRHQAVHLHDSFLLKEKIYKRSKRKASALK